MRKDRGNGNFTGGPEAKNLLPMQGVWVRFLVGEVPCAVQHSHKKKSEKISGLELMQCNSRCLINTVE